MGLLRRSQPFGLLRQVASRPMVCTRHIVGRLISGGVSRPEISKDSGRERTIDEALSRIDRYFIQSPLGDYVLGELRRWDTPNTLSQLK